MRSRRWGLNLRRRGGVDEEMSLPSALSRPSTCGAAGLLLAVLMSVGGGSAVAMAGSAQGRYYAVQLFGRPASQRVRFGIANRAPQAVRYELDGKPFELPPRATRTHEQCGQSTLRLQLPGSDLQVLHPAAGDHLRVEQLNGRWRLAKE